VNPNQLDQLRDTLRRETQHIQPVGLGVETVQRRGRRRRNRGRALVAVGAATCVAGLGVTVLERGSGAPNRVAVGAQPTAPVTPALEFRVVDGTVSDASTHFTTAAGVTYDLATAPGIAAPGTDPGQAIYATSDGEHWTTATQDKSWITDLTQRDGVLYAIGTAPGSDAGGVQYRVGTSTDGGGSWSDTDLPFDLSSPSATVPLTRSSDVHLASGSSESVAVLSEVFSPDLSALIAARTPGHTNVTARQTDKGYNLVDLSACIADKAGLALRAQSAASLAKVRAVGTCADAPVLGTISWSDIGLSGPGDLARNEELVSTDGTHWSSVAAPTTADVNDLVATNDGFLLLATADNPATGTQLSPTPATTLMRSTDARTWTNVSVPAGLNVQAVSGASILAEDASGTLETSTDGGTTWNATSTAALLPAGTPASSVTASDVGPLGFAVLVSTNPTPNDPTPGHDHLLFSTDGVTWTTTDLSTVGEPAADYAIAVTVGADHLSVDYGQSVATPGGTTKIITLLATPKR
jgi:hypothetical protein